MNSEFFSDNSTKELILTRIDFDKNKQPRLKFADKEKEEILNFKPTFDAPITLEIDTSERFCCGWHSLDTGEDFTCFNDYPIDKKYDQCMSCKKRTGFNPAFYNVNQGALSEQQQRRNSQPHFVYLAYFSEEIIKVGISFAGRGITRLLEQGARAALILGEFSSAEVARSYEDKIAKMQYFCENVKTSRKEKELVKKVDFTKASISLINARELISKNLNTTFEQNIPIDLQQFYSKTGELPNGEIISVSNLQSDSKNKVIFSGKLKAQIGYFWLAENDGKIISIPLKKFTGYKIILYPEVKKINLPEYQTSLFDF